MPRLSIAADLSTGGESVSNLFSDWLGNLGANLLGPIFDGGFRQAEVERLQSVAEQEFYQYGRWFLLHQDRPVRE